MIKAIGIVRNYKDTLHKIEVRGTSNLVREFFYFQGVLTEMLTVAYVRMGGIKNC